MGRGSWDGGSPAPSSLPVQKYWGSGAKASAFKSSPEKCRASWQSPLALFLERMGECRGEGEVGVLGQGWVTGLKEKGQGWRLAVLRREATRMDNCHPLSTATP